MAFCTKCGAPLADGASFCGRCGNPVAQTPPQYQQNQTNSNGSFQSFMNTPDYTAQMDPRDIAENKVYAVLAYFGILVLIPIFAAPQSKFAKFHANQALILDIVAVVLSILMSTLCFVVPPLAVLFGLLDIPVIIWLILGIVNAANGVAKELPITGKLRILN